MTNNERLFSRDAEEEHKPKEKLTGSEPPSPTGERGEGRGASQASAGGAPEERLRGEPSADETHAREDDTPGKEEARDQKADPPDGATLREHVRHATSAGSLRASYGDISAGESYNLFATSGDWRCCARSENPLNNPFLTLYLDHEQHERITPEMVKENHNLLLSFWRRVLQDRSAVADNYGGKGRIREEYARRLNSAYGRFKTQDGNITCETVRACYEEVRAQREGQLTSVIDAYLDDDELNLEETRKLFGEKNESVNVPLEEQEIAGLLQRVLEERGFEPLGDPQGETPAERLRSVRWMTAEKRRASTESEAEAGRTSRVWIWAAGALLMLGLLGFGAYRLAGAGASGTPPLSFVKSEMQSRLPEGYVLAGDPALESTDEDSGQRRYQASLRTRQESFAVPIVNLSLPASMPAPLREWSDHLTVAPDLPPGKAYDTGSARPVSTSGLEMEGSWQAQLEKSGGAWRVIEAGAVETAGTPEASLAENEALLTQTELDNVEDERAAALAAYRSQWEAAEQDIESFRSEALRGVPPSCEKDLKPLIQEVVRLTSSCPQIRDDDQRNKCFLKRDRLNSEMGDCETQNRLHREGLARSKRAIADYRKRRLETFRQSL